MEFRFEIDGDQLISRRLERFAGRSVDARPAFGAMADTLRGYEKRLFDSEGGSSGAPWSPLADSTRKAKTNAGQDPRILHATLALRRSLADKRDPEHEEIVTPTTLVFGSKLPYARFHQKGEGVPRRRPLEFNESQKRYLLKKLQRYLVTGEV